MSKSILGIFVSLMLAVFCISCSKSEPVVATASSTEALSANGQDAWSQVEQAFQAREYKTVVEMATALMEEEGASVRGLTLRGVSYAKLNKPYWSFYDLIDAAEIERSANTLMNVGNALRMFGFCTRAADAYQQALALAPTDVQLMINISSAYLCYGAVDEADLVFQKVFANFPKDATAYTLAGTLKSLQKDYQEAQQAAQKALEIDAFYKPAYKVLAAGCRGTGNHQCAVEAEKQYKSLDGAKFKSKRVARGQKR